MSRAAVVMLYMRYNIENIILLYDTKWYFYVIVIYYMYVVLIYWYFYVIVIYYMYVVLILRLATGSGYENSHSLAPVMTPQIGSWQSWYQSLGLELYHLGYLNGVTVV